MREHIFTFVVVLRAPHNERNLSFRRPVRRWWRWPDISPFLLDGIFIEDATDANDDIRILFSIFSECSFWMDFSEPLIRFASLDGVSIEAWRCLWNNEKKLPEDKGKALAVTILVIHEYLTN